MSTTASIRPGGIGCRRWTALCATGLVWSGAVLGCSGTDRSRPSLSVRDGDPEGPVFYAAPGSGRGGGTPNPDSNALMGFVDGQAPPPNGPISAAGACVNVQQPAQLVKQPVDIIVVLDNSGSMEDEADAVESNINQNFASVLASSAVDYRVILISRHRRGPRDGGGEASTSICVQMPLSGLASCDAAPKSVFSERFFQYSTKIESDDSFDVTLDTYLPPFESSDREEKFDQAPFGWSAWLRPGAKKVFLEVTDADEVANAKQPDQAMSATSFITELQRMAPEHFGTDPAHPSFVFHSIVGLVEKDPPTAAYLPADPVTTEPCKSIVSIDDDDDDDDDEGGVTNAGMTYQELSRLTGGLRFPLCQFDAYDVVFQRIAEDVVLTRGVACDFAIPPPPPGRALDLDNVAIAYASGTVGTTAQLGQAATAADCQPDAFYIEGGRLNLCPESCTRVRSDPLAAVSVLFTCESQIIVPR